MTNTNFQTVTELMPQFDSRKSFYHKALIIRNGNVIALQSYDTIMLSYNYDTQTLTKKSSYSSLTTNRHIKEFLKQFLNFPYENYKKLSEGESVTL